MSEISCPRCGGSVSSLMAIDAALEAKLVEAGHSGLPSEICEKCFTELAGTVARGSVLLARAKAKEQRKMMLWKSRVNLIKKARAMMAEKAFSDAAVAYEKYIRVLEVVFDAEQGELNPEHFKDSARTQELTVVASAYWDLVRIYDTSDSYGDRMEKSAAKLALFLRFTPLYPDIMKKAEAFQKTARRTEVIKSFLKSAQENKGRCFIATTAFESPWAPEVMALRQWRDGFLSRYFWGRWLITCYYTLSPLMIPVLHKSPKLREQMRSILRKFLRLVHHK